MSIVGCRLFHHKHKAGEIIFFKKKDVCWRRCSSFEDVHDEYDLNDCQLGHKMGGGEHIRVQDCQLGNKSVCVGGTY